MIRTLFAVPLLGLLLAMAPAVADQHEGPEGGMNLEPVFDQMELRAKKRTEVREVLAKFRKDRAKAREALKELSQALPPHEEVRAMQAYSEAVLQYRLSEVLTDSEVDRLMQYMEEQRRLQDEEVEAE